MSDPRYRENITVGMKVKIEESKNFGTGVLTLGKVSKILTKESIPYHPNGILILLESGEKGNAKEIIRTTLKSIDKPASLQPESSKLEYKETLFFSDLLETNPEKAWKIPHSIFKSIAGFANAEGGELWIGVNDQLQPIGLERDYPFIKKFSQDRDGYELTLTSLSSHYFKQQQKYSLELFEVEFPIVDNTYLCKISVKRSIDMPLILYDDNPRSVDLQGPYFYVRQNNSTQEYSVMDFFGYWMRHFKALHGINI